MTGGSSVDFPPVLPGAAAFSFVSDHRVGKTLGVSAASLDRARSIGLLLLSFAAGFALAAASAHFAIDRAGVFDGDLVVKKPREAANQRPELVFVGPSHLATGVIPEVFDAEVARYAKLRSFNLAIGGLTIPQTETVLRRFFALQPCCVKYVVVYPGFELTDVARNSTSTRSIAYFSLPNALRFWRFLGGYHTQPQPPVGSIEYAENIALSVVRHYSNIGAGLAIIGAKEFPADNPVAGEQWTSTGFIAIDRAYPDEKEWTKLAQSVARDAPAFKEEWLSDDVFSFVKDIIDLIHANGAMAILVRPPSIGGWQFAQAFVRKYEKLCASGPPLLDFGDPAKYPDLFEVQTHVDGTHLNLRGATIWSKMLADQIGEMIKSGRLESQSSCKG